MTKHTECRHPATSTARQACRTLRAMIAKAERLGLDVDQQYINDGWVLSVMIKNPADTVGTTLICTLGMSLSIVRSHFLSETKKVSNKSALIWIGIIARDWQKEN